MNRLTDDERASRDTVRKETQLARGVQRAGVTARWVKRFIVADVGNKDFRVVCLMADSDTFACPRIGIMVPTGPKRCDVRMMKADRVHETRAAADKQSEELNRKAWKTHDR